MLSTLESAAQQPISGFSFLGVYNQKAYYVSTSTNQNYFSARATALGNGGELVKIETPGLNFWLRSRLLSRRVYRVFIGLNDLSSEGNFRWQDNSPLGSYRNWMPGEPNNANNEDAVEFRADQNGYWNDVQSTVGLPYIMMRNLPYSNPSISLTNYSPTVGNTITLTNTNPQGSQTRWYIDGAYIGASPNNASVSTISHTILNDGQMRIEAENTGGAAPQSSRSVRTINVRKLSSPTISFSQSAVTYGDAVSLINSRAEGTYTRWYINDVYLGQSSNQGSSSTLNYVVPQNITTHTFGLKVSAENVYRSSTGYMSSRYLAFIDCDGSSVVSKDSVNVYLDATGNANVTSSDILFSATSSCNSSFTYTLSQDTFSCTSAPTSFLDTGAIQFTGAGNLATNYQFPELTGNIADDWTIESWVKPLGLINGAIFGKKQTATGTTALYGNVNSNGSITFGINRPGSGWSFLTTPANTYAGNKWMHLSFVKQGDFMFIYVNGVEKATRTILYHGGSSPTPLLIGVDRDGINKLNGQLDEFKVWDKALTPVEITSIFAGNTASSGNVLLHLDFSEATGTVAYDKNNNGRSATFNGTGLTWVDGQRADGFTGNFTILTATDGFGNKYSDATYVNLIDTVSPTTLTQNITVQLDANGNASITAADLDNGSTDNCGITTLNVAPSTFNCANVGANTVTLTATDASGNISSATAVVTVEDNIAPSAVAQNITVQLDANGNASINAADIDNGSTDNCSITSSSVLNFNYDCSAPILDTTYSYSLSPTRRHGFYYNQGLTRNGGAYTIECLFRLDDSYNGGPMGVIAYGSHSSWQTLFYKRMNVFIDNWKLQIETGQLEILPDTLHKGKWYHVAVSYNAGQMNVYVNGLEKASYTTNSYIQYGALQLGKRYTNAPHYFTGEIGMARAWNRALTSAEILNATYSPVVGSQNNLLVHWDFSEGNGSWIHNSGSLGDSTQIASHSNSAWQSVIKPYSANHALGNYSYVVQDQAGNSDTTSVEILVLDTIMPDMQSNSITVNLVDRNTYTLSQSEISQLGANSSDNCSLRFTIGSGKTNYGCNDVGQTFNLTLIGTDAIGNKGSAPVTVTIADPNSVCNDPPVAACAPFTVSTDGSCEAFITAADVDGGSNDPDGDALTYSVDNAGPFGVGTHTVTLTVSDGEYSDACTAAITVEDNTLPTAIAQNVTVQLDASGNASITAADIDNGSTDNCGIATLNVQPSTFTCANIGSNTVTLTATDVNGNTSSATAVVTVEDNIAPSIITQNLTVQLDANGNATITAADINNGSADNCGIATLNVTPSTFNCANVGNNTVTLTATDAGGNISSATAVVTVEDNIAPSTVAQNIIVQLDASGNAIITAADIDNGSTDNCGIATLNVAPSTFNCANVGANTVTLTATDASGNISSATAVVTVEDNIAPSTVAQNIIVQLDANGNASITAVDIDNGSNDACGIATLNVQPSSFTCANIGSNTVTLTATDVNGNTSSATAVVTVEDNIAPSLAGLPNDITVTASNNTCSETVSWTAPIATDNCGVTLTSTHNTGDVFTIGTTIVSYTATDASGNSTSESFTITVNPSVINLNTSSPTAAGGTNISCAGGADGSIDLSVSGGCAPYTYSWSNGASTEDINHLSAGTYTVTVTGNSGTTATASVTLTEPNNALQLTTTASGFAQGCGLANNKLYLGYGAQAVQLQTIASGGSQGYTYSWAADSSLSALDLANPIAQPLATTTYFVTVTDINGCNVTDSITVTVIDITKDTDADGIPDYMDKYPADASNNNRPSVIAYLWDDQDADGKQDVNEPYIGCGKVKLKRSNGQVLHTAWGNAASGFVVFFDLTPGEQVKLAFETINGKYAFTHKGRGGDHKNSDADRNNGNTRNFTLPANGVVTNMDAGMWAPGVVETYVWDDRDADGKQDASEPAIAGVKVFLKKSNGQQIGTAWTNNNGVASFNDVPADTDLKLQFEAKQYHAFTYKGRGGDHKNSDADRNNGNTRNFKLTKGSETYTNMDAGLWAPGTVQAYVWDDRDADGKQDANEPAITGAKMYLKKANGQIIKTAWTDSNGLATMYWIPTDVHLKIQFETVNSNYAFTHKGRGGDHQNSDADRNNGNTRNFKLTKGSETYEKMDAGLWAPGFVEAYVWDDRDGDGKQDSNEPAIDGVRVRLKKSNGQVLQTLNTDISGLVLFSNVPADQNVKLEFEEKNASYAFTHKGRGSDHQNSDADRNNGNTRNFKLTKGSETYEKMDAGLWAPGFVEAYVWDDRDGDGKQDNNEPALTNVKVELKKANGQNINTAWTDANGIAHLDRVPADENVKLTFNLPNANYAFTHKGRGGDHQNSDVDRNNGSTRTFKLTKGSETYTNMDGGLWAPGSIETYVWDDANKNGKQDASESALIGAKVFMKKTNGQLLQTQWTNANGIATFTNVPANADVKLEYELYGGFVFTDKNRGGDHQDSDADKNSGQTHHFKLTKGSEVFTTVDAGQFYQPNALVSNGGNENTAVADKQSAEKQNGVEGAALSNSENPLHVSVGLYPNPTSGLFTLSAKNVGAGNVHFVLTDVAGKLIEKRTIVTKDGNVQEQFDLQELPSGVYLMQIIHKENREVHKVIKE